MERIQFVTYDGSSPNGKNYIFLAAHPEDAKRYFKKLRQEIWAIENNCAFWFDSTPEKDFDGPTLESIALSGMQMFLFPVTSNLLCRENTAIKVLLPFAKEHHIAIMPILMESGLEERYNRAFGDLQYLDRVTMDITAIPYEEKLKRYLKDHLVSRETAEKIRAAFDAYIFLSYRKKDRALAAKLMKLIHEIPQMRDVAIWYDEFLVPGENFNDNIDKALAKSDLFAMAVTPNLVNEDNYVLKHEYPNAQDAHKPILAAQVADTDMAAFRNRFEELPGMVDAYNNDMLKEALFGHFKHISLAQNDDPMHSYLIGLAYLNGIDVEVNHERALELITQAAERNVPEAYEKIVSMYYQGEGVARNIFTAIEWQKKYVQMLENATNFPQRVREYINALELLGDLQMDTDAKSAFDTFEKLGEFLNNRYETEKTDETAHDLSVCYNRLGALRFQYGDFENAKVCYNYALRNEIARANLNTPDVQREVAIYCVNMGNLSQASEDYDDAEEKLRTACNLLSERLPPTMENRRYLALAYHSLGEAKALREKLSDSAETKQQKLDDAAQWFTKALEIRKQLAEETGEPDDFRDLATACFDLGKYSFETKRFDRAWELNLEGHQIIKKVAEETDSWDCRCLLACSYVTLGETRLEQGEKSDAKQWAKEGKEICERMLTEPRTGTLSTGLILPGVYYLLGRIYLKEKNYASAKKWVKKALDVYEIMEKEWANTQSRRGLYNGFNLMAEICRAEGNHPGAKKWTRKSHDLLKKLKTSI